MVKTPTPTPTPSTTQNAVESGKGMAFDPNLMMLPYLEVSRALLRAHHNALAMMEANRTLSDSLRSIVRRQQDLAFEIAEAAIGQAKGEAKGDASTPENDGVFQRAADAVREIGEAMISAQLNALDTLQAKARPMEMSTDAARAH